MARILEVRVRAGDVLRRDDVIAVLDDRDVRARAEQARATLAAAQVEVKNAETDLGRNAGSSPRACSATGADDAEARSDRPRQARAADASRSGPWPT
jgi:multidrug resistance efflux pump